MRTQDIPSSIRLHSTLHTLIFRDGLRSPSGEPWERGTFRYLSRGGLTLKTPRLLRRDISTQHLIEESISLQL
jgi:hypothetical protein